MRVLQDSETRATDDHHQSLRLWLRLLATTSLIENRIRTLLQSSFDITLPRFDMMAQLVRASDGHKMSELSQRLMVTGGFVSGFLFLLEEEGLVVSLENPTERRAIRVKLTDKGRKQFKRMAVEHEKWIIEMFEDFSVKRKDQLAELLHLLKTDIARKVHGSSS